MLSDTKLSTIISPQVLFKLQWLGDKKKLAPNEILYNHGDDSEYLYVTLEGELFLCYRDIKHWMGPGDFIGEIGFILGTNQEWSKQEIRAVSCGG